MKRRILILSMIVMLIMTFLSTVVIAATTNYTFIVSMNAKNSRVTAGSEVLITVKLSNLNVGENGINSFSAYLSYDTDVFEVLTESSVDGCNGWVASYNAGTGKVSLYKPTFLTSDEEVMQISLKTKADLSDGTHGEVKLSMPIVSNSNDEIAGSAVSTNITIGSGENPNPPVLTNTVPIPINTTVPEPEPEPEPVPLPEPEPKNEIVVANEIETDIPYTGTDSNALAKIIIGVIFIALVLYIKIERMNKNIR